MPSPVWECEISCDGIAVAGRPASSPGAPVLASRIFVARDSTIGGVIHGASLAIIVTLNSGISINAEWTTVYRFVQKPFPSDPFTWVDIQQPLMPGGPWASMSIIEPDGNNGASFFNGGLISITKDFDSSQFVFSTPLGGVTVPFVWLSDQPPLTSNPWVPDNGPLVANGFGHALAFQDDSIINSEATKWFNFFTRRNGLPFITCHLTSVDPGVWTGWNQSPYTPPFGYITSGGIIPTDDAQEVSRYRSKFIFTPPDFAHESASDEVRYFLAPTGEVMQALASVEVPEHGAIWFAYVYAATPDTLTGRVAYDNGKTWQERTIYQAMGSTNNSPSLLWEEPNLYAIWHDGVFILHSKSTDLGVSWSTAMPIAIATGSHPYVINSPDHGLAFYFYIDGSNNLQLIRSGTYGNDFIDASPHQVVTGIDAQTISAEIAADGTTLLVGYIQAGVWQQVRSRDWGLSWA